LGVRPEHDGLRIDPVLPAAWGDVTVTRRFRGSTFAITIRKAVGAVGRVDRLIVNGVPIQGSLCPVPPAQGTVIDVVAEVVALVIDLPVASGPIPIKAAGTADGPPLEVA